VGAGAELVSPLRLSLSLRGLFYGIIFTRFAWYLGAIFAVDILEKEDENYEIT